MTDPTLDDLAAFVPVLLQALETLGFVGRHFHPPRLAELMAGVGARDEPLRAARPRLDAWPPERAGLRAPLVRAADHALAAFDALRTAAAGDEGPIPAFRAFRHLPLALEALYPFAYVLPPVGRFFLSPDRRADLDLQQRLAAAQPRPETGLLHVDNTYDSRGGFSLYVPETYVPETALPLVVALHGGSGHGRAFLFSWLRDARSRGVIVAAPTSTGPTWALNGPDPDTPNLKRIVAEVSERWSVDPRRILLTGLSDGGTFAYVSGLEADSPFTHLAPVAAAFHPMLAEFADRERLNGLPVYIVHGALDWMFPPELAREANRTLTAGGAAVVHREIADLSHTYPQDMNPAILDWLMA
ncbi:MAG: phospholipase [Alphaproteobacteria bacterium]